MVFVVNVNMNDICGVIDEREEALHWVKDTENENQRKLKQPKESSNM